MRCRMSRSIIHFVLLGVYTHATASHPVAEIRMVIAELTLCIRFAAPAATNGDVGPTPAGGIVGIGFIYVYAFGWSFGHSVACYVVSTEIFPTRIVSIHIRNTPHGISRSLTTLQSLILYVYLLLRRLDRELWHYKSHPNMITEMRYGTFLPYLVLTYVGVIFIHFCLPEMKGISIESMDYSFRRPL
jgi:hypothetical protein